MNKAIKTARGLGWFSIAIGAAEVLAPRLVARACGLRGGVALVQAFGVRELATGIGLLTARDPQPWVWARVAGDGMDLAALGLRGRGLGAVAASSLVGAVAAADVACAEALRRRRARLDNAPDYSDRSGWPQPAAQMRGAARDFDAPQDMKTPSALRPYTVH